ncbi:SHOCT domain-containing protein [uncultured Parabacteroides sp.]|uniref:SHOCT domain-containing protein n=1 Tax=uncultured Parabacteroides sp. TaxID=512312 RepID=UPI0025CEFEC9|nr:SHOCT domain-containing protein [uncultured Parabacteroides sp.]
MVKFTLGVFSFIFLLFVFAYIESEAGNVVAIIVFIFIAVFIIGLIMASYNNKKIEERKESFASKIKDTDSFRPTRTINGVDNLYQFSIDNTNKKVLYLTENSKIIFEYSKIISAQLIEDNTIISSKSALRTAGGAILGGAIAGGAGMIVGGLSGDTTTNKKVSCVKVVIGLRDIDHPSLEINCFNARTMTVERKKEISINSMEGYKYKQGLSDAKNIISLLSVIIDEVSNGSDKTKEQERIDPSSIIDQLTKLAELKEKGLLTDEEFSCQKTILLSSQHKNTEK